MRSNVPRNFSSKPVSGSQNNQNFGGLLKKQTTDSSLVYEYYYMQGHFKDKCFCVVGYPSWNRLFGKPKPKPKFSNSQRPTATQVVSDVSVTTGTNCS